MSERRFYRRTLGWEARLGPLVVEYGFSGRQTGWQSGTSRRPIALVRAFDRKGWSVHIRRPARYFSVRRVPAPEEAPEWSEPRTEAGKRLLDWLYLNGGAFRTEDRDHIEAAILAIEGEAAHPKSAPATSQRPVDLRAALDELAEAFPVDEVSPGPWVVERGSIAWMVREGQGGPQVGNFILEADARWVADARNAALASPDTGVAEEAGPSRTWWLAEGAGLDALPDNACGVMGLCELLKGHEGKHTTSVDRALEGVVLRAAPPSSVDGEGLRAALERLDDAARDLLDDLVGWSAGYGREARIRAVQEALGASAAALDASGSASGAAEEGPE